MIFRGCSGCANAPPDGTILPFPSDGNVYDLVEQFVGGNYYKYCATVVQDFGDGTRLWNFTVSDEPPCDGNLTRKVEENPLP